MSIFVTYPHIYTVQNLNSHTLVVAPPLNDHELQMCRNRAGYDGTDQTWCHGGLLTSYLSLLQSGMTYPRKLETSCEVRSVLMPLTQFLNAVTLFADLLPGSQLLSPFHPLRRGAHIITFLTLFMYLGPTVQDGEDFQLQIFSSRSSSAPEQSFVDDR
jgi:hypothetical protein